MTAQTMKVPPDWADDHIAALSRGESVRFRPRGRSMEPLVMDNQEIAVEPITREPMVGDIVLVTIERRTYLHKILQIDSATMIADTTRIIEIVEARYLIGNNRGGINGWVCRGAIHGRVTP